jgi:hypothetical protein
MTEQEWLEYTDPTPMLDFFRGQASKRKLRLFACACWRRAWRFLPTEADRRAVVVAERFADGLASVEDLPEPFDENGRSASPYVCCPPAADAPYHADVAAYMCARAVTGSVDDSAALFTSERRSQTDLLRDIFGMLRSVSIEPSWLAWNDSTIPKLAQSIYDERAFDRLPILAVYWFSENRKFAFGAAVCFQGLRRSLIML